MAEAAVEEYKESLKIRAENLAVKEFPEKIMILNEVMRKMNFHEISLRDVHEDVNIPIPPSASESEEPRAKKRRIGNSVTAASTAGAKVYILPNGPAPCNRSVTEIIRIVKPHIRQLLEDCNALKMWIEYLNPRTDHAENLAVVDILDTIQTEIQESETKSEEFLEGITNYFINRAKIVSKVAKHPHLQDYRRAVIELDEEQFLILWLTMNEIRNRYCVLYDLITKNLDKIKMPQMCISATLY